jgi:hypothetical protein
MLIYLDSVYNKENLSLIYSSLGAISSEGRKYLKNIVQFLLALQNRHGSPVPDSISQEIIQNSTNEMFYEL